MKPQPTPSRLTMIPLSFACILATGCVATAPDTSSQANTSSSMAATVSSVAAISSEAAPASSSSAISSSSPIISSSSIQPSSSSIAASSSSSATQIPAGSTLVYAINAGGPAMTISGVDYKADDFSTGGNPLTVTEAVAGTTNDALYQTFRWGKYKYEVPVTNSTYSVALNFAEMYHTAAAGRYFSVSVEGQPVLTDSDLFAEVGAKTAYDVIVPNVMVADGKLTIELTASIDNGTISAFAIYSNAGGKFVAPEVPPAGTGVPGNYPLGNTPVKSTGCGTDGKAGLLAGGTSINGGLPTSTQLKIQSNNQNREYIVDIPANYDKSKPYRLFYTSHWIGSTDNAVATGDHGMANQSATNWSYYGLRRLSLAAGEPAIFVAPQSDGQTWQEKDNRFLFNDILQKVTSSLCIDESRVFATGFSFGAMITYSLSTNKQKQIRAAVGISPANFNIYLPSPLPRDPIAWMSTTGMGDTLTPWDGGGNKGSKYAAQQRAQDNGCTAATIPTWNQSSPSRHVCYDYQGCKANYPVKVCTFNGGHDPAPHDGGSGSDGLNSWVPTESWKFFRQF